MTGETPDAGAGRADAAPGAGPADTERVAALRAALPAAVAARVLSLRLTESPEGAVASLVLDGGGLDAAARTGIEAAAEAALTAAGIAEVRMAMMADRAAPPLPRKPRIVAVGSGKGGVGKSTLAANLAIALMRMGRRVGLVDADIYGPSQPTLMGNAGVRPQARDKQMIATPTRWGVPLLSMGQLIEAGKAIAWRGPMAAGALGQLVDADWGDVEILIVDLPPGTGDIQLTMVQKHKPAGAVIVSTPQDLALIDAARAMSLFDTAGVPVIGLVENMAGYVCPHCGEVSDPFGHGGVEAAAAGMGHTFLGRVPLTLAIRTASDAGAPPAAGDGPEAGAFAAIARAVAAWLDAAPGAPGAEQGAETAQRAE